MDRVSFRRIRKECSSNTFRSDLSSRAKWGSLLRTQPSISNFTAGLWRSTIVSNSTIRPSRTGSGKYRARWMESYQGLLTWASKIRWTWSCGSWVGLSSSMLLEPTLRCIGWASWMMSDPTAISGREMPRFYSTSELLITSKKSYRTKEYNRNLS